MALFGALALAGCASIPVGSMLALSRVNFQTTEFRRLRIAVQLPAEVRTARSGVRLDSTVRVDGEPDAKAVFHLVEDLAADERPATPPLGHETRIYRLAEAEADRLDALRAEILRKKEEGKRGSLAVGIETREFCRAGEMPTGPVMLTTYLKTSETGRFILLTDRFDLRGDAKIGKALADLPPC
jgi:hypothetical protein